MWGGEFVCVYVGVGVERSMWISSSLGNIHLAAQPILAGFSPINSLGPKNQSAQSELYASIPENIIY